MPRISLALPPGVVISGTDYSTKGRYVNANFVRWYDGSLGPILGWRQRSTDTLSGAPRAALAWNANDATQWLSVGTHSNLYASNVGGDVFDITPSGFVPGKADAIGAGGYGSGTYGSAAYGTPRPSITAIQDATEWSLDHFGENLVGVSPDDGVIWGWALNTSDDAVKVANSPACKALVVTDEGFLFALATTNPRTVSWCDQQDDTVWSPDATNQAGDYPLQTGGRLMCGKSVQGGTLLLTDRDAHLANYAANNNVYDFAKKGDACGAISRQAMTGFEMKAFWMSPDCHFWQYNGYVQPVVCDVQDYIIRDINLVQASKVVVIHNSANFEIEIYYCSASSNEIDRCVVWNYQGQNGVPYWNIGRPPRTCGVDVGTFRYPIRVDIGGTIYDHEVGLMYDGTFPFATGGPVELGNGDFCMSGQYLIPDDLTMGDVSVSFDVKMEPDGAPTTYGPYTVSERTSVRFTARQVEPTYTATTYDIWRVGAPRLDVVQSSRR